MFAGDHVNGSFSFDVHGNAVTYLGWMIDWGTPITLLGETVEEVAPMQRELVRIGIDRPVAYAVGSPADWSTIDDAGVELPAGARTPRWPRRSPPTPALPMLDLRRDSEWSTTGYVAGAKHVPLHELRERVDEVVGLGDRRSSRRLGLLRQRLPRIERRSILEAAGVPVVHVDDDFVNAEKAGLPVTVPVPHETLGEVYAD